MSAPVRLLVLEDNPYHFEAVDAEIRQAGIDLHSRRVDTAEAFTAALEERWDAVLADFRLPGFTALDALAVLEERGLDVPLIVVSGTIDEESALEVYNGGARDFITKQRLTRLVPALKRVIHETELRREHARAELELETTERFFRSLYVTALDAIIVFDDDGYWVDVNPAAEKLFGLPRAALLGKRVTDFAEGDDREKMMAERESLLEEGSRSGGFELRRADGQRRFVEFAAAAHVVPGRHLSILRDVTERKRLEDELMHAQKMEAIGRLAGGVAHDFNNILLVIRGYAEILTRRLAGDEQSAGDLQEILDAAGRAAGLTEQLLAFSRRQVIQPVTFCPNDTVEAMRKMLERLIGEDIAIDTSLAEDVPAVHMDRGQLEQIIVNLAVNARDAMPDGGTLRLTTCRVVRPDGAPAYEDAGATFVRLRVVDTGHGMDSQTMEHAFEPFFTTKEPGSGTGLGLATVYGAVHAAGGSVEVHSEIGRGTTIDVYLPVAEHDVYDAHGDGHGDAAELAGTETVLLVEDDVKVRSLVKEILDSFGYSVVVSRDASEAVEIARNTPVDLLLTDLVMPDFGGDEVAAVVRCMRPETRVIFMSGYADRKPGTVDVEQDFIKKPFSADELARRVRDVLDR